MAHLPPKVPNITWNWPSFAGLEMAGSACRPSFADEFSDFTASRRGNYRRSEGEVAFVEAAQPPPYLVEIVESIADNGLNHESLIAGEAVNFDRLDDDQLMTMFTDDVTMSLLPSSSPPSTPSSDQNSNNDEKHLPEDHRIKKEYAENANQDSSSSNGDTITDPKRVKRILANRQSAQRSRVRKLQYISELERSVTSLQTEVSSLSPKVAFLDHQRLILNVDNSALKQRIAALAQDKIFKDAHQEALKKEIERLRHLYHQQNLKTKNSYGSCDMISNNGAQPHGHEETFQNCSEEKQSVMGC